MRDWWIRRASILRVTLRSGRELKHGRNIDSAEHFEFAMSQVKPHMRVLVRAQLTPMLPLHVLKELTDRRGPDAVVSDLRLEDLKLEDTDES